MNKEGMEVGWYRKKSSHRILNFLLFPHLGVLKNQLCK